MTARVGSGPGEAGGASSRNLYLLPIVIGYDEFERLRLTKAAGEDVTPDVIDYDGLDRRDTRTIRKDGPDPVRDFSYIGTSELLSRDVDDDGAKRFYDYDSDGDRVGQQVSDSTGNRYHAYAKDANGSVLGLEDEDGVIDQTGDSMRYE
jgi:hypothetical protein